MLNGETGVEKYKTYIASAKTPKEQCLNFRYTPYAEDPTKSDQMWRMVQSLNLEQYNK